MMRHTLTAVLATMLFSFTAQAGPRIDLENLPHREGVLDRRPVTTVARWEPDAFLESIVIRTSGDMLITEAVEHPIYHSTVDGDVLVWHQSAIKPMGLAIDLDDTVVATGRDADDAWHIFVFAHDGALERAISVPEAHALNGATFLRPGVVLANDAAAGRIYRIDLDSGTVSTWLDDELLRPDPARSQLIPGANGIKIWRGAAYVSNTSQMSVLRIPLDGDDFAAGTPKVVHEGLIIDDFAFAEDGTIYATTHIFDTVIRIEPDGSLARIATAQDGVAGSTALAFGRLTDDETAIYVVADGGYYLDPEANVPAFLTRIEIGEAGLSISSSFAHEPYPGETPVERAAFVSCSTAPGSDTIRTDAAGRYTRFLELNFERILMGGQIPGETADSAPRMRHYVVSGSTDSALSLMQRSPYALEGVYGRCTAVPFDIMLGRWLGGVAWPNSVSTD